MQKGITIGICDDNAADRDKLQKFCERVLKDMEMDNHTFYLFQSAEEVLYYCENMKNKRIDILFLDIEMPGMDGICLKNKLVDSPLIWRILFTTYYREKVFDAFGLKTIGFLLKPVMEKDVSHWLSYIKKEVAGATYVTLEKGKLIPKEDILYCCAEGNYTKVYIKDKMGANTYVLIARKLRDLEQEWGNSFIRIHKSYLVNLCHVSGLDHVVYMKAVEKELPIGRSYKEKVKEQYVAYGKEKIRGRI